MVFKIRDWEKHFERDRSKQWATLKWVPIPNKQGAGYRKIMSEKNGLEIFACWIALIQTASLCSPRGDMSKYNLADLSRLTLCDIKKLETAIIYLSQHLDWIEVIENLDKNVNECQKDVCQSTFDSSILSNSILSNSSLKSADKLCFKIPSFEEVKKYCDDRKNTVDPQMFIDHYEARGWQFKAGQKMKSWQAAVRTWEKNTFNKPIKEKGFDSEKWKREHQGDE